VLPRIYLIDCEKAARYWSYGTEEDDETEDDKTEDDETEEEAIIKEQETEGIEEQIQANFSEQSKESGREDQEEKQREAMRRLQGRVRRARLRLSLLCPPQQVSSARLPQSSSDEDLLTSAEEMPQNEQREFRVSQEEHDRVNRLNEMLLLEELEETKTSLEAFL
jgi:hypothetical protein